MITERYRRKVDNHFQRNVRNFASTINKRKASMYKYLCRLACPMRLVNHDQYDRFLSPDGHFICSNHFDLWLQMHLVRVTTQRNSVLVSSTASACWFDSTPCLSKSSRAWTIIVLHTVRKTITISRYGHTYQLNICTNVTMMARMYSWMVSKWLRPHRTTIVQRYRT